MRTAPRAPHLAAPALPAHVSAVPSLFGHRIRVYCVRHHHQQGLHRGELGRGSGVRALQLGLRACVAEEAPSCASAAR